MEKQGEISARNIAEFSEQGVTLVRGAISDVWIELLRKGIATNIETPTERGRVWDRDDAGRVTFYDSQAWRSIPEYRDFVLNSPMAEIAGRVMNVSKVNFFFDAVFVRSPGAQFRTPFHQDEPFWSVEGFETSSCWMPLVSVERKSALEFVAGSHRWDVKYEQQNFGALTGDDRDQVSYANSEAEPFPDIEGHRDDYDIISWDMEPGDVAIFNARMIHGGSGNLAADRDLRVFNTQWLGDDVRVRFREEGMDPDHTDVMTAAGLSDGDVIGTDLYPELWRR